MLPTRSPNGDIVTRVEIQPPMALPASPRPRWRISWSAAGLALLLVIGVGVNQYPSVASWLSQYYQSLLITDVSDAQATEPVPELLNQLQRAHTYNDLLIGGALIEANNRKPTSGSAHVGDYDYSTLLNATSTGVMGRLRIPSIQVDLPIYHGTDDITLTKGVGHLEGTSLPVGGLSQHTVLTAHRGLPEATLFDNLDRVSIGDTFTVELFGEVLTYRVFASQVVEPDESRALNPVYGRDLATLVTCTPLGINSHRILVTAERVTPTPVEDIAAAGERPDIPGFPWWTLVLGATLLMAVAIVWRTGYPPRPRPKRAVPAWKKN